MADKIPTKVRRSQIAGISYRPQTAQAWVARMAPKQALQLRREPTNKFDKNAIMIWIFEQHLGYIPAGLAAEIAPLMDRGFKAGARKSIGQAGNGVIDVAWECPDEAETNPSA